MEIAQLTMIIDIFKHLIEDTRFTYRFLFIPITTHGKAYRGTGQLLIFLISLAYLLKNREIKVSAFALLNI